VSADTDDLLDRVAEDHDRLDVVDDRRDPALVVDLGGDAVRRDDLLDQHGHQLLGLGPGDRVEHPHGAADPAGRGDHVVCRAGPDDAPHHADAGAGVQAPRQDRGQLRDDLRERVGQVLGEVRTGRVTAGAAQRHLEVVGGAGDRALAEPHLPDVEARVAVQPEDPVDARERAVLDQRQRSPGHHLLRRLEEQPHPAGQLPELVHACDRDRGADQRGGVHVVAAGVGHALDRAGPGVVGEVRDRQRVQVGAQRHRRSVVADLGDQAGARQRAHPPAGARQPRLRERGGADLPPGQLRVGVQVTAQRDELGTVLVHGGVDHRCDVGEFRHRDRA